MVANEKWFGASAGFYPETIDQSLRFEDGDSANLYKNFSASNRKTNTFSFWVKRGNLSSNQIPFSGGAGSSQNDYWFRFLSNDTLEFRNITSNSYNVQVNTSRVFRDTTNWYHIVLALDTTQATASNRVKIYVNGEQQTLTFTTTPAQDSNLAVNYAGNVYIGRLSYSAQQYFDGYIAEFNFIDGTALDPTSFGETKNGVWIPKAISGLTYGTNGYRLTFADSSSSGDDTSGNGNDFTSSGLASTDVVLDSPSNNFCTFNNLYRDFDSTPTYSEGNLRIDATSSSWFNSVSTFSVSSGKWYAEFCPNSTTSMFVNIMEANQLPTFYPAYQSFGYAYYNTGQKWNNGSGSSYGDSWTDGDIIGVALDMDNGNVYFYKNGVVQNSGTPAFTGLSGDFVIGVSTSGTSGEFRANFGSDASFQGDKTSGSDNASDSSGQGTFYETPPSGYLALCSSNLSDTTISPNSSNGTADEFFNTVLYTGDGNSTQDVTGVGFQPDWTWIKERSSTSGHVVQDSSRGYDKFLVPNGTTAESTGVINSVLSDGFQTTNSGVTNQSGQTYVAWNWKAGGTTPTKTYKVVVVSDSGNKFRFRNSADSATFAQSAVTLNLQELGTYTFDVSDSSMSGHALKFSTTSDGIHGGGSEYTTGVTSSGTSGQSGAYVQITVASSAPTLYYYCGISGHSGMGGQINTNSTHGSTNFDGSILSVVQTNETAKFSILTYTGTGTASTIGHGLGVAPRMVITKVRNTANNWGVYHSGINDNTKALLLDTNGSATAYGGSTSLWNNTAPTSTVFSVGTNSSTGGSANFVAYVFAEVEGYSKFGSYQPNGSTDGTYIHLGFSPSFFMAKSITANGYEWVIIDNKRTPFNERQGYIRANEPLTENTSYNFVDFLSNGIKIRAGANQDLNNSSHTLIYMAFGDGNTAKFSNAR